MSSDHFPANRQQVLIDSFNKISEFSESSSYSLLSIKYTHCLQPFTISISYCLLVLYKHIPRLIEKVE